LKKIKENLLVNKWQTPNGTILQSRHGHDYVSVEEDGQLYAVDGGLNYSRVVGDFSNMKDLCVYDTDSIEQIRQEFEWGSYGVNGDEQLKRIKLKDLTEDHVLNILKLDIPEYLQDVFSRELEYRNDKS